ncbi:MAG: cell division protein FtsI [Nocardioides sp.]|nr:cell division protein FtsI [Nocardioides sp.]
MNKPIRTLATFSLILFLALMLNATYLQFWAAGDLDADARNRRVKEESFASERGAILVNRTPVAESEPSDDQYQYQRVYPEPLKYAPLTGYFSFGDSTGLESSQNAVLSGDDPRLFVRRLVDLLSNEQKRGGNVQLTIDPAAQQAAYDGLKAISPDVEGAVVALEPSTGKILAMVSLPTFDPNDLSSHDFGANDRNYQKLLKDDGDPLVNRAVQTRLFPGSTFKVVTATAGLESGKYEKSADAMVPGGDSYTLPLSTKQVTNEGRDCGSGEITLRQAMENSCNTTFAAMAADVGSEAMLEQSEKFGFNSTYLEDLPGQVQSVYPSDPDESQTAQTGFGQFEVQATPLQMAMVAAAIAADGDVMRPYVVEEVQSAEYDAQTTDPTKISTAMDPDTAEVLTEVMVSTVDEGTATAAQIPDVAVAGKTGTAQRGTDDPPYAWFISFAPADDPQVAVAVMIEEAPGRDIAGGALGGPIAKAITEAVLK